MNDPFQLRMRTPSKGQPHDREPEALKLLKKELWHERETI